MPDESRHDAVEVGSEQADKAVQLALVPEGTDYKEIYDELMQQTERGAAVLGGAHIEWRVRQAIKHTMVEWDVVPTGRQTSDPVGAYVFGDEIDDSPGKLGFFDQCRVAYCMGLIGPIRLCDLKLVAKIRNRFAHHVEVRSFTEDREVREYCEKLQSPKCFSDAISRVTNQQVDLPFGKSGPRSMYLDTIHLIWIAIYHIATIRPDSSSAIKAIYFW
jgi:hypothetical protein